MMEPKSPFINVKNHFVASLSKIAILAVRTVYNRKGLTSEENGLMERSIVHWSNKIDISEEDLHTLQLIGKFLKQDENGEFEDRKETFKKHGINFMKFHRMPHLKELGNAID